MTYEDRVIEALETIGVSLIDDGLTREANLFFNASELLSMLPAGSNRTGQARYYDAEYLDNEIIGADL